jgi:hypothetical protein
VARDPEMGRSTLGLELAGAGLFAIALIIAWAMVMAAS